MSSEKRDIDEIARMLLASGSVSVTTTNIEAITKELKTKFEIEVKVTKFIHLGEYFLQKISN